MAKKDVLIIEDEPNIARAEALILKDDFNVHHAYDGESGLKIAKRIKPALVILDLMLPKRGGYDICFNLRQDKDLRDIKVIMVTAKNRDIDEDKGMLIGADDYLMKPFEPEELLYVVNQVMSKK